MTSEVRSRVASAIARRPHLAAGAMTMAIALVAVLGLHASVRAADAEYVHATASADLLLKPYGLALVEEAFRHDDLLPAYGSSELLFASRYDAYEIFRYYQSGFQLFSVATPAATPIVLLQRVGAVGRGLRGRKVVVTVTPPEFFRPPLEQASYTANFSTLHATAVTFATAIPYATRQAVARRLLQYPTTVAQDAPLRWSLECLATSSWLGRVGYALLFPIGKASEGVLRLQDEWVTLLAAYRAKLPRVGRAELSGSIDWDRLEREAGIVSREHAANNPFGFHVDYWHKNHRHLVAGDPHPVPVVQMMVNGLRSKAVTQEWEDLDLLLAILKSLGASPLLVSGPFPGAYLDEWGITAADRAWYYARMQQLAAARGVPVVDFQTHDEDRNFDQDPDGHLSDAGWVHVARALDDFYHGAAPDLHERPVPVSTAGATTSGAAPAAP